MERTNLSNWSKVAKESGLLFFAEAVIEMLFHHSHDSLKVNTLNFKFFWYDFSEVIRNVETDIMEKGNLEPYLDELNLFFSNDIVAQEIYGTDIKKLFTIKESDGRYIPKYQTLYSNRTTDASITLCKHICSYVIADLECKDKYFSTITDKLLAACKHSLDYKTEREVYLLTQSFLSEIINRGYSQEFVYRIAKSVFFSEREINDIEVSFNSFISYFTFSKNEYLVYFPLSRKTQEIISQYKIIETCENIFELFDNKFPFIGKMKLKEYDPEQARQFIDKLIDLLFSVEQFQEHHLHSISIFSAYVVDKKAGTCLAVSKPLPPILRGNGNIQSKGMLKTQFKQMPVLFSALELHSSALKSNDINNQLLNLWTAIEILIPIDRKGSFCKINQICNILTSVLASSYFRSLLIQLLNDLNSVRNDTMSELISHVAGTDDDYLKLSFILALPEYKDQLEALIDNLSGSPLLQYRVTYYSGYFSDLRQMNSIYENHVLKLRSQVMRIYRCRNMIVHDGTPALYIELIIQNLHFYFDSLLDTIYQYTNEEEWNLETIYKNISLMEIRRIDLMKASPLNRENLVRIIG